MARLYVAHVNKSPEVNYVGGLSAAIEDREKRQMAREDREFQRGLAQRQVDIEEQKLGLAEREQALSESRHALQEELGREELKLGQRKLRQDRKKQREDKELAKQTIAVRDKEADAGLITAESRAAEVTAKYESQQKLLAGMKERGGELYNKNYDTLMSFIDGVEADARPDAQFLKDTEETHTRYMRELEEAKSPEEYRAIESDYRDWLTSTTGNANQRIGNNRADNIREDLENLVGFATDPSNGLNIRRRAIENLLDPEDPAASLKRVRTYVQGKQDLQDAENQLADAMTKSSVQSKVKEWDEALQSGDKNRMADVPLWYQDSQKTILNGKPEDWQAQVRARRAQAFGLLAPDMDPRAADYLQEQDRMFAEQENKHQEDMLSMKWVQDAALAGIDLQVDDVGTGLDILANDPPEELKATPEGQRLIATARAMVDEWDAALDGINAPGGATSTSLFAAGIENWRLASQAGEYSAEEAGAVIATIRAGIYDPDSYLSKRIQAVEDVSEAELASDQATEDVKAAQAEVKQ